QLAENIREVFWLADPSKNEMLYISPAYEEIWGRSTAALYLSPRDWTDAIHPEDRGRVIANAVTKQTTGHYDEEYRITRPDGSVRWIHDRGFPVRGADQKIVRVAGVAEDITERKQAEKAVRASELRYRRLFEAAKDGILILNADTGQIIDVNPFLVELLGIPREKFLLQKLWDIGLWKDIALSQAAFRELQAKDYIRYEYLPLETHDGRHIDVEFVSNVYSVDAVRVIQCNIRDITERRKADVRIKRLNRVYSVLSGINSAIVRIRNRQDLFQEACRIIVEHGQFSLGWIAALDHATGKVVVAAQAGLPGNVASASEFFNGSVGLTPARTAETALREKRAVVDNNIEDAPGVADVGGGLDTLKVRRAAIELGAKSVIVLPLVVAGENFGILTLYASERNFFDNEEIKLLNELAGDISFGLEFIASQEKVDYLAYYDELTGLANLSLFLERLGQKLKSTGQASTNVAVFALDLDRFKSINEALGRRAGDDLLKQVAGRLLDTEGDVTRFARVSADRYAIFAAGMASVETVGRHVERKLDACFRAPFRLANEDIKIFARVGISMFPGDGESAEELYVNAEAALKKAKAGGDRFLFYTEKMTARVAEQLGMEHKLRQAFENEEFVLHYQPKVDLESRSIAGVEALIRWQSPALGLVPPVKFIPMMEETGMILEVGAWALSRAVADHCRWTQMGLQAPRVAVNVSAIQLRARDFVDMVNQALSRGATPAGIDLEITESLIMENIEDNIQKLEQVGKLGVGIAIDDFGTGYSSLAYLAKLPVQTLKIDRSFVITMLDEADTMTLVQTIITMAHSLRLKVVAEGVDSEAQAKMLRLLRCDEMQGFLFSKAVPFDAMTALLRKTDSKAIVPRSASPHH
ncbi:MAG: EAL domain-containing protein, partial [Betaproteobacteria bacterium]